MVDSFAKIRWEFLEALVVTRTYSTALLGRTSSVSMMNGMSLPTVGRATPAMDLMPTNCLGPSGYVKMGTAEEVAPLVG